MRELREPFSRHTRRGHFSQKETYYSAVSIIHNEQDEGETEVVREQLNGPVYSEPLKLTHQILAGKGLTLSVIANLKPFH